MAAATAPAEAAMTAPWTFFFSSAISRVFTCSTDRRESSLAGERVLV